MNPASSTWPLLSPSSSFIIRAPLTSDDQSSGSEINLDTHSDSASEGSELEPEPVFKPVARLTEDDDVVESGEESFDEVDGDGFVVRVRIPNPDLNPGFDNYEANDANENEVILGVDGDGLLSSTVVNSSFDPGDNVNVLTSSSEESFETVDGDGFSVRAKRDLDLDVGFGQDNKLDESVGVKDAILDNLISSKENLLRKNGNLGENFEESEVEDHSSQKSDIVNNVEVEEGGDMHDTLDLEGYVLGQDCNLDENLYADEKSDDISKEANLDENVSVQDSNDMNYGLHLEDDFVGQKSQNDSSHASFNAADIFRNYESMEFSVTNSSSSENYSAKEYLGDSEADDFVVDSVSSQNVDPKIYSDTNYVGKNGQSDSNYSYENEQEKDDNDAEMFIKDRFSSASTIYNVMDNDDSLSTDVKELSLNESVESKGSNVTDNEITKDLIGDECSGICTVDDKKVEIFSGDLNDNLFVVDEDLKVEELESKYYKIAKIGDDENIKDKEVEIGAVYVEEIGNATFSDEMNLKSESKSKAIEMHKDGIEESCYHQDMNAVSVDELENVIADSYQKYEPVHGDGSISVIAEVNSAVDNTVGVVSNQKHEPDEEVAGIPNITMLEEDKRLLEKVEALKVKFLRVIHKLGFSPHDTVPASVLYRLSLIAKTKYFVNTFESTRKKATDLESKEEDNINFSCNILIIGKAGVGKSATLNSIFKDEKSPTNTFQTATSSVRLIEGVTDGIRIRVLDTPGLGHYLMDQTSNIKILSSIKRHMKKYPLDVVLYVDRLDMPNIHSNDLPLFKSITNTLGQSIWTNAIITLTHAGKAPPDDSNGLPLSYEEYVNRRSHVIQVLIRQMVNDISLIKPVVLVENQLSCTMSRDQNVLPNESLWKSELLLLCCSSKILSEANSLNPHNHKNNSPKTSLQKLLRSFQTLPIQFFLTSALESKNHPKLSPNYYDIDFDEVSDGENEKDEYDQLPKFCPLTKSQIAKLSKEYKRAYFEEYDYRVKLLQKIQIKEEIRRLKELSKRKQQTHYTDISEEDFEEALTATTQEIPLPPSFDSENPVYRYRLLDQTSQFYTGYFIDPECFDHDYGLDGVSLQKLVATAKNFPDEVSVRLRKDKKNFSINLDSSICAKYGKCSSSLASFDIKTMGDQVAYILKNEAKFKNFSNKSETTVGISSTFFRNILAPGVKLEKKLMVGKRFQFDINTGATRVEDDVVYGANLEATLMKMDSYPMSEALAIIGLSLIRHQSRFGYGSTLQSDLTICRNMKMNVSVGMNNNMQGQVGIKLNESEQVGLVHFLGFISVSLSLFRRAWLHE